MKFTPVKFLSALALVASMNVHADDIRLGTPGYGGNGCPAGTASATLSPDQKSLSLIFDQFMVEAGGVNPRVARKSCNLAIPVHIPQGFSVSIISADYRGFASVPAGGRAMFSAEFFFAGGTGPRATRTFMGPVDTEYTVSNAITTGALVWSRCGEDVNLRVNASMTATSNAAGQEVLSTVDSADIQAGVIYRLSWKRC